MSTATLYLVATPIGNLADMVPRALAVLQSVDAIAVEDSRHSGKLLQHFNIRKPLIPYHDTTSAMPPSAFCIYCSKANAWR